jgi:L-fucose isomerase-like protein
METLKIGFVPAHREPFDEDWAAKMRQRCLDAFPRNPLLEIIVPDKEFTKGGCVRDDNEAERVINFFRDAGINGLIIGTMTFGDEVSALSIASAFRDTPILLFGTKEGPFTQDGNRRSDSFCGTLSISSGLHRRKIKFMFGGIVFPEEAKFQSSVDDFLRVCAIEHGFIDARIGLVGPRPERFETCIFSEDLLDLPPKNWSRYNVSKIRPEKGGIHGQKGLHTGADHWQVEGGRNPPQPGIHYFRSQ